MTTAELGIVTAAVVMTTEVELVALQTPISPATLLDINAIAIPGAKKSVG
jgi:hypothetical protein